MNKGDGRAMRARMRREAAAEFDRQDMAPVLLSTVDLVDHLLEWDADALDASSPEGERVAIAIDTFRHYLSRRDPNESPYWVRRVRSLVDKYDRLLRDQRRLEINQLDPSVFDMP